MKKLGIIDADLLDNGTRHLIACMKISLSQIERRS